MNTRSIKQRIVGFAALAGLSLTMMGAANAVPVTYEVGSYSEGGYSASWLHGATGCSGTQSMLYDSPLYMCGDPVISVTGTIEGNLIGGFLAITGGSLLIDGLSYAVGGGGFPPDFLSSALGEGFGAFEIENFGYFIYEPFSMGSGLPNYFDGDEMILWGQNIAAYACTPEQADNCHYGARWGLDLYGKRIAVPEPGTLALFGIGLLALTAVRRRRTARSKV